MLRGIEKKHEQDPRKLLRDTRTLGEKIYDFFEEPRNISIVCVVASGIIGFFPEVFDLVFITLCLIFWYTWRRKTKLPFRLPMRSGLLDYNDLKPGGNLPYKARGICFFGNDRVTNEELWFTNEDMRTHVLIFGSTGSGKTEALISIAYNALVQSSGFIYVDGKGDNSLFAKIFSMARSLGREDDVLVINFMTGARDIIGPQEKRLSNTLNPFASGSSSMISQLVISLMDSASGGDSSGDMWKGRAMGFVEAIMKVLVYMRDDGKILLDANVIRNYFLLERLEAMTMDKIFIRDNAEPVNLASAPPEILEPILNYVLNLPGYDKSKKGKQVSQVLEQHGFITMQLTRIFTSLADTYGHILRVNLAEVDVKDVVLNRRILVVLLPALEKSPDELANLGKVIIAALKAMMASGLGEEVEGDYRDVITRKPTNSKTPYMCIMDEYGYYAVPGFAVVPAQARSLGFSAIFAGQDLPAFQKASKEEALSIGANTNIKVAMKLEDPIETWDFFMKTAGEALVTKVDSFQTNPDAMTLNYADARSASSEKRARIDLMDLKEQREGEAHIFFRSTIIRMKFFFANPSPVPKMRLNHFLRVTTPDIKKLVEFERRLLSFGKILEKQDFALSTADKNPDIPTIATFYQKEKQKPFLERGVAALITIYNRDKPLDQPVDEEPPLLTGELNIFVRVTLPAYSQQIIPASQWPQFSAPILNKALSRKRLENLMRIYGKDSKYSVNTAKELLGDMEVATKYPPVLRNLLTIPQVILKIDALIQSLDGMKT